jgi:hypothetical protein
MAIALKYFNKLINLVQHPEMKHTSWLENPNEALSDAETQSVQNS